MQLSRFTSWGNGASARLCCLSLSGAAITGVFKASYPMTVTSQIFLPGSWSDLDKNITNYACIGELFPNLKSVGDRGKIERDPKKDDISGKYDNNSGDGSGCLSVNWYKHNVQSQSKWEGNMRFLLVGKKKNLGFISFSSALTFNDTNLGTLTHNSGGNIFWKNLLYVLLEQNGSWDIWKMLQVNEFQKLDNVDLDSKFPKAARDIYKLPFWGLFNNKEELKQTFQVQEEFPSKESYFWGYWKWKESKQGRKKFTAWTDNFKNWLELFKEKREKFSSLKPPESLLPESLLPESLFFPNEKGFWTRKLIKTKVV